MCLPHGTLRWLCWPGGLYTCWEGFARVPMHPGDTARPIIGLWGVHWPCVTLYTGLGRRIWARFPPKLPRISKSESWVAMERGGFNGAGVSCWMPQYHTLPTTAIGGGCGSLQPRAVLWRPGCWPRDLRLARTKVCLPHGTSRWMCWPGGPCTCWEVFARVPMHPGDTARPIIGLWGVHWPCVTLYTGPGWPIWARFPPKSPRTSKSESWVAMERGAFNSAGVSRWMPQYHTLPTTAIGGGCGSLQPRAASRRTGCWPRDLRLTGTKVCLPHGTSRWLWRPGGPYTCWEGFAPVPMHPGDTARPIIGLGGVHWPCATLYTRQGWPIWA